MNNIEQPDPIGAAFERLARALAAFSKTIAPRGNTP